MLCDVQISQVMDQQIFSSRPPASYSIQTGNEDGRLYNLTIDLDRCGQQLKENIDRCEPLVFPSASGNTIACLYFCVNGEPDTILCLHDRASDNGDNLADYVHMGQTLNLNILAVDCAGYGASTGEPSEAEHYTNAFEAFRLLTNYVRCLPHEIYIFGRGLGSAVAIDVATKVKSAGVILVTPLLSALRTHKPALDRTLPRDKYCSIDKIGNVTTPTLVVQGRKDEVFSPTNATTLCNACPAAVNPLLLEDAGHSDCLQYEEFYTRAKQFVKKEAWRPLKQRKRGSRRESI